MESNKNKTNLLERVSNFEKEKKEEYYTSWRAMRDQVFQVETELRNQTPLFLELIKSYQTIAGMAEDYDLTEEVRNKVRKFIKKPVECKLKLEYGSSFNNSKRPNRFEDFRIYASEKVSIDRWPDEVTPNISIYRYGDSIKVNYNGGDLSGQYGRGDELLKTGPIYIQLMKQAVADLPKLNENLTSFLEEF